VREGGAVEGAVVREEVTQRGIPKVKKKGGGMMEQES